MKGMTQTPGWHLEETVTLQLLLDVVEWTGIGTDTITTHGHPAFDARDPSCDPAPLTPSFGTVGQWERWHRATAPATRSNST